MGEIGEMESGGESLCLASQARYPAARRDHLALSPCGDALTSAARSAAAQRFAVYRPTSKDAIAKMLSGVAAP